MRIQIRVLYIEDNPASVRWCSRCSAEGPMFSPTFVDR